MARLKVTYNNELKAALMEKFSYRSVMEIPKLEKVIVNMGLGSAKENPKVIKLAAEEIRNW